ncbi:PREDICTED: uncharacterized protein LOC109350437 [Lupinus angustifolius]|uniref:uncharacterized protein LOC109350437 n=1 Tax=Lupinus angustifolius TaxID=3871 RepID=UPI00092ED9D7|nr:PREDICTED: uncharacterized protein LOC109350437 [Lupinus angustifolius]
MSAHKLFMVCYVDDIIITGTSPILIKQLIEKMNLAFALKDIGALDYIIGIEIQKLPNGSLLLTKSKYIKYLLQKYHMDDRKSLPTPMVGGCKLTKHGSNFLADGKVYRSLVEALRYITITRPEISYSISKVADILTKPLSTSRFTLLRDKLHITDLYTAQQGHCSSDLGWNIRVVQF